jgi:hypothetical protein
MPMFSAADLAYMGKREEALLDKTCTVQQRVDTNGPQGPAITWTTRATGVPCALFETKRAAHETHEADTVRNVAQWLIRLRSDTVTAVTDRILIGPRTFQVEQVITTSYPTLAQVLAIEVL